jgi:hypothetical protein
MNRSFRARPAEHDHMLFRPLRARPRLCRFDMELHQNIEQEKTGEAERYYAGDCHFPPPPRLTLCVAKRAIETASEYSHAIRKE